MKDKSKFGGVFELECLRLKDPATGKRFRDRQGRFLPRQLVWKEKFGNIVVNEGLDAILDIMFHGSTQISPWYCVMFENDHTPAAGNTYNTPGYTETEAYDGANRPAYDEAAASSQSITNSASRATFTINATKTLYGGALVGGGSAPSEKGNTAGGGTLFACGTFATERAVVDDDVVNFTYTLGAADDAA